MNTVSNTNMHAYMVGSTLACLSGLEKGLARMIAEGDPRRDDSDSVWLVLARIGDALRLGLEESIPVGITQWASEVSADAIEKAIRGLLTEIPECWELPSAWSEDHVSLLRRDEVDSFTFAAGYLLAQKDMKLEVLQAYQALEDLLQNFDGLLGEAISREEMERFLGVRGEVFSDRAEDLGCAWHGALSS